jgi:hypothetical protein
MIKKANSLRPLLLSLLALLAGITWGVTTAPRPADAAPKQLFVYVHDRGASGSIAGYGLSADGLLTPLSGSPFNAGSGGGCGGNCGTLAYSAQRKLLFAGAGDGVHVFSVAAGGGLSEVTGSPFGGVDVLGVAVIQKNKATFVYAADWAHDQILGYRLQSDGSLVVLPSSPYPAFDQPVGAASTKDLVFFANGGDNTISAFRAQASGALVEAPGSPFPLPVGASIYNLQLDPTGKTLYVGDGGPRLFAFKVNPRSAVLTPVTGSPFDTLTDGGEGVAPGKKILVVLGIQSDSNLQALRRLGSGAVQPLGAAQDSGANNEGGGSLDPSGKLLIIVSGTDGAVKSFRLDQNTGLLTPADTEAVPLSSPNAVIVVQR